MTQMSQNIHYVRNHLFFIYCIMTVQLAALVSFPYRILLGINPQYDELHLHLKKESALSLIDLEIVKL